MSDSDSEEMSLLGQMMAAIRARAPKYPPNDPAVDLYMEQQFASALASHANSTVGEAWSAVQSLSPCIRTLTATRPGWCLLARHLCEPGTPDLIATLH